MIQWVWRMLLENNQVCECEFYDGVNADKNSRGSCGTVQGIQYGSYPVFYL